jgi:hypothetical protein
MLVDTGAMDGPPPLDVLRAVASTSLYLVSGTYRRREDGDLQFDGHRPGPGWHAHGYFCRWLWMLGSGRFRRMRIWKRRWYCPQTGKTCHSRPFDDLGRVSVCGLTFVLLLSGWLCSPRGLAAHQALLPELEGAVSRRTLWRWLHRLLPNALTIQHDCRRAVIERCEPRPVERLFPRGLSPPEKQGTWRDPQATDIIWRGFAFIISSAEKLSVPASLLLAEARGRSVPQKPDWI